MCRRVVVFALFACSLRILPARTASYSMSDVEQITLNIIHFCVQLLRKAREYKAAHRTRRKKLRNICANPVIDLREARQGSLYKNAMRYWKKTKRTLRLLCDRINAGNLGTSHLKLHRNTQQKIEWATNKQFFLAAFLTFLMCASLWIFFFLNFV